MCSCMGGIETKVSLTSAKPEHITNTNSNKSNVE